MFGHAPPGRAFGNPRAGDDRQHVLSGLRSLQSGSTRALACSARGFENSEDYNTRALPPPVSKLPKLHQSRGGDAHGWRQKFGALSSVRQFLHLVWRTHRGYATATVLLRLLRAGIPIATLWVAKLIIDTVVAARMGRPNISRLWLLVGLELVIVTAGGSAGPGLHCC